MPIVYRFRDVSGFKGRCDLEGIVAKRKMWLYREDRPDWLKIKNRTYSQAEGRHEMLTRARKKN